MRAALLPAGGDPFLIAYWLRHYRTWADEVDELRVMVCGQNRPEVQDYIRAVIAKAPHAIVDFLPNRTDHGQVLRYLVDATAADLVLFCEDDAFVRRRGVIDERFARIESGATDVVGTARGNATDNLIAAALDRFGEAVITETGEAGHSLYPCFLFARASDLAKVTNFSVNGWQPGDFIPSLNYTATEVEACDTFTLASWELRAAGLRIEAQAAYRSAVMSGDAPWFHVGSLSSGYGGSFMSDMTPESYAGHVRSVAPVGELVDWHKRMSWWTRVWDRWDGGIPEHHAEYGESLQRYIRDVNADPAAIAEWRTNYDRLVTWDEA